MVWQMDVDGLGLLVLKNAPLVPTNEAAIILSNQLLLPIAIALGKRQVRSSKAWSVSLPPFIFGIIAGTFTAPSCHDHESLSYRDRSCLGLLKWSSSCGVPDLEGMQQELTWTLRKDVQSDIDHRNEWVSLGIFEQETSMNWGVGFGSFQLQPTM